MNIKRMNTKTVFVSLSLLFVFWGGLATQVKAEESLTLSVTPPLFQLTIGPGEFWASSVKVVNVNPYDLTVYASLVNFEPSGEEGRGKLTPVIGGDPQTQANTLATWIEVTKEAITVPKESSAEVPFTVRIPADAPPGGHYAAILIGTQPLGGAAKGATIQVSSYVTSLFFVRVNGEVIEAGGIQKFSADRTLYGKADVTFTLRFENRGNVHLQPQGYITIANVWGKEVAMISINERTEFGNVLPKSARKFTFSWQGDIGLLGAGIYRAVATLAYGQEARENVSAMAYFWVIPPVPTALTFGGIIGLLSLVTSVTRISIRRALQREAKAIGYSSPREVSIIRPQPRATQLETFSQPLRSGVIDLRATRGVATKQHEMEHESTLI